MDKNSFKTCISSDHRLLDLHLKETLQYKDLIFLFVKRDFVAKYKQTILGPLWAIIQPLLTTVVFTVIFGSLAKLTTADVKGDYFIPAFLFYMSGNICWAYFSSTLQATSNTFLNNRATMGKVYYPRLVSPIATAFSNLISGCGSVRIPRACGRIALPQSGSGSALAFCQTRKPSRHWAAVRP